MRVILSQGEVRPGLRQGQYWCEGHPRRYRYYATGPDGARVPLDVYGGWEPATTFGVTMAEANEAFSRFCAAGISLQPTPFRRPDPRLSNPVVR